MSSLSRAASQEHSPPDFAWRNGEWIRIEEDGAEHPHVMHAVGLCRRAGYHAEHVIDRLGALAERINANHRIPAQCQEAREALLVSFRALTRCIEQIVAEDLT